MYIYKIFLIDEWRSFQQEGEFKGSPLDSKDGFIHMSTEAQLEQTLIKHFNSEEPLVIASFKESDLSENLKWEPSRNGDLFPHLYGRLLIEHVISEQKRP
jgi:uncharacterized protein (DUF952 family)